MSGKATEIELGVIGASGAQLIDELNEVFDIYTKELRDWRLTGVMGEKLADEKMFDVVIKLLDKSDKIKKLNTPVEDEGEDKPKGKIKNVQDWALNKSKSA